MTLVFSRAREPGRAQTHVFVIGCGRFPVYREDGSANRRATVAGAREFIRFFLEHADDLIAPLGSIEAVLSDPASPPGQDGLGLGDFAGDPRENDDAVGAANRSNTEIAGNAWLDRCEEGDHLVFYMSSHGVADRDRSAVGLLEDVYSLPRTPWAQSLNVSQLATNLPTLKAGACWVFLDACQEIVTDLIERDKGAHGITFLNPTITEQARAARRYPMPVALAGSRLGGRAWAENDDRPPFFTRALLLSLKCCVEPVAGYGWAVTGQQLLQSVGKVADAALNRPNLETQPLAAFNSGNVTLLRVENPRVPVVVRTRIEAHMAGCEHLEASDGNGLNIVRDDPSLNWQFTVPPSGTRYTISGSFRQGVPRYADAVFFASPAAQIVQLKE